MVLVNGTILDRDTIAITLNDSPPWTSYELAEEHLVPISDDAAAVVYRARAARHGDEEPFDALMTSVYRSVDGEPRLALYQQTAIPDGELGEIGEEVCETLPESKDDDQNEGGPRQRSDERRDRRNQIGYRTHDTRARDSIHDSAFM